MPSRNVVTTSTTSAVRLSPKKSPTVIRVGVAVVRHRRHDELRTMSGWLIAISMAMAPPTDSLGLLSKGMSCVRPPTAIELIASCEIVGQIAPAISGMEVRPRRDQSRAERSSSST